MSIHRPMRAHAFFTRAASGLLATLLSSGAVLAADPNPSIETVVVSASPITPEDKLATIVDTVDRDEILRAGGANLADALLLLVDLPTLLVQAVELLVQLLGLLPQRDHLAQHLLRLLVEVTLLDPQAELAVVRESMRAACRVSSSSRLRRLRYLPIPQLTIASNPRSGRSGTRCAVRR